MPKNVGADATSGNAQGVPPNKFVDAESGERSTRIGAKDRRISRSSFDKTS
jgi:hypothetical protein